MARCLIVDNSSVIRKVAKRILSGMDIDVSEATSGSEALAICTADMPDTIIVDGVLPDMTASEFIQRVMQLVPEAKPRVLLCVPEIDIGSIMRAKRAGATGYMLKPFTRPQLLAHFQDSAPAA